MAIFKRSAVGIASQAMAATLLGLAFPLQATWAQAAPGATPDATATAPTSAAPASSAPTGVTPTSAGPKTKAPTAAAEEPASLGQIVVTARRVAELLQDVPLTITALTGRDMQERGVGSIAELSLYTPGLSYSPDYGRTQERPVIRGISAIRPEAPQPVSVFIDGVFVRDAALGLAIDDAQRVEVIKGPQSALYGRATYAGAINYITIKPGDSFRANASVTMAQAGERTAFAAVTLPLMPEFASLRLRARHYEFGGQYTNQLTGNRIGNEKSDSFGALLALRFSPAFDALLSADSTRDRDGLFSATIRTIPLQAGGVVTSQNGSTNVPNGATCDGRVVNIVGNNAQGLPDAAVPASLSARLNGWPCGASTFSGTTLRRNEADFRNYTDPSTGINYGDVGGLERRVNRGSATLNYSFGDGWLITSQTALTKQRTNTGRDESFNGTRISPFNTSWLSYDRDRLQYASQEFRLTSPTEGPLSWMVGVFGYREESKDGLNSGLIRIVGGNIVPDPLSPKSSSKTVSTAPFARMQYAFSAATRLSLEARYSSERVTVGGTPLGTAVVSGGSCVAGQVCRVDGDRTFTDFAPRVTVDHKINSDTMVYGQFAKGSKSGGFNIQAGLPDNQVSYEGEQVRAYEIGAKNRLLDGKLLVNLAAFRNDINGLQLSNLVDWTNPLTGQLASTTIVNNVGKARTQGVELEVVAQAAPWLRLSTNYAFTEAKAIEGTEVTNGTVFGGNRSVAGFVLPRSPKHSLTVSAAVDTPLANSGWRSFGRVDVIYQSRRYSDIQNMIWGDPFTRVNLSLGVADSQWRVTAYVKNATNDNTALNGFRYVDPGTFRRTGVDFLPRLRQAGLTVAYAY